MNIRKSIILRVRIAFIVISIVAIAIGVRIVHLQYVDGAKWKAKADEIGLKYKVVKATRGNIYSDNGSLLATSLPEYRLAFDPTVASDEVFNSGIKKLSAELSKFFKDNNASYYERKITDARLGKRRYVVLNRRFIGYQEKKEMSQWPIFVEGQLKGGVIFEKVNRRERPFSYLGYRTIGFINANSDGAGLEYSYNKYLSGTDGQALYRKVVGGKWRPVYDGSEIRPIDGFDIETTINVNIQDVTESSLLNALEHSDAEYGSVVVMEVATGEIKAISNLKRNGDQGDYREIYNYAVQGLNDPGSTFKLASMIALLEDSHLKLTDTIETGDGEYKFYNSVMRDHKPGGYGALSVKDAFEQSSNIAISKLVTTHFGNQPEKFLKYLQSFGLDKPLGFQMIGEGIPKIKYPNDPSWSGITLPWMSIGYEIEYTPLQILAFYNAVANNGKMIKPKIVNRVRKADKIIEEFDTEVLKNQICSNKTLEQVQKLLEGVVQHGTANNIKDSHYSIAGKTGTAQKIKNGRYTKKYYTSFVGYFPADAPKYSCIVVIDQPKGFNQYGSNVAAPVFKEIADKIYALDIDLHSPYPEPQYQYTGIYPVIKSGKREDLEYICDELKIDNKDISNEDWVHTRIEDNAVLWTTNKIAPGVMPDVSGMTLRDAIFLLENMGLQVSCNGKGRVLKQSATPGSKVKQGSQIQLTLG